MKIVQHLNLVVHPLVHPNAVPKLKPGESYMEYSKRMKTQPQKESVEIQEGEKDACYHKVKSRYSV